jgi:hypothetical protein
MTGGTGLKDCSGKRIANSVRLSRGDGDGRESQAEDAPHALNPFEVISSSSRVRITQGTQSLCIDMLAGPPRQFTPISAPDYGSWGRSNDSMNDASAAPSDPNAAAQYHGKFASTQTWTAAEFIVLLRVSVECNDTAPTATKTNGVRTVQLNNGATVTIAAEGKCHVPRVRIHRAQPR